MFFKDFLTSVADSLQSKYEGMKRKGQNPADIGELCELFMKEFLIDYLSPHFNIFRGGKIVDIHNSESKQIDIVITAKNSLKIFRDKGIYPIESVVGVFSITSTLGFPKLLDCIHEFNSIPKENPRFQYNGAEAPPDILSQWKSHFPYKCIFAFSGDMDMKWESKLCDLVEKGEIQKTNFPDTIIINKKGVICKIGEGYKYRQTGELIKKDFHFTTYSDGGYYAALTYILNKLFILSQWQFHLVPRYYDYFNRDIDDQEIMPNGT